MGGCDAGATRTTRSPGTMPRACPTSGLALPSARRASTTKSEGRCTRTSSIAWVDPAASPSTRKRCNRRRPRRRARVSSSPATTIAIGVEPLLLLTVSQSGADPDRTSPSQEHQRARSIFHYASKVAPCAPRGRSSNGRVFSSGRAEAKCRYWTRSSPAAQASGSVMWTPRRLRASSRNLLTSSGWSLRTWSLAASWLGKALPGQKGQVVVTSQTILDSRWRPRVGKKVVSGTNFVDLARFSRSRHRTRAACGRLQGRREPENACVKSSAGVRVSPGLGGRSH